MINAIFSPTKATTVSKEIRGGITDLSYIYMRLFPVPLAQYCTVKTRLYLLDNFAWAKFRKNLSDVAQQGAHLQEVFLGSWEADQEVVD